MKIPPLPTTSRTWLIYAILVAVLSSLCFASVTDLLLDTHDDDTFRDHERIVQDFSFFFSPDKDQPTGRPTVELLKYVAFLIRGNDSASFHVLVVFFHALASFLLAWTAHRLGATLEISLTGGLLFLLNVSHYQAVYWISALDYPLALICSLGAVLCYVRYEEHKDLRSIYAFHTILPLGVLAHPSAVMIWFFCLYWSWSQGAVLKTILPRLLPFILLLVPTALLVYSMSPRTTATWPLLNMHASDILALLLGMLRALLWLLSRLFTTAHWLSLPAYQLQKWELVLGAFALAGFSFLMWKKKGPLALWTTWIMLSFPPFLLLTESTITDLPAGPSRYLYPATAGTAILSAWLLDQLRSRLAKMGDFIYVFLLIALLASSSIYLHKAEAISLYTSGRFYLAKGDIETGTTQLQRAIARGPDIIDIEDAYVRLIMASFHQSEPIEPALQRAQQLFPDNIQFTIAHLVLDSASPDPLRRQQAQHSLYKLKDQGTGNVYWIAQYYKNLGDGFYTREEWDRAIDAYRQVLEFHPERMDVRADLGWVLFLTNRFTQAIAEYKSVLQQGPHSETHFNLALAYLMRGDVDSTRAAYATGIEKYGRSSAEKLEVLQHLQRLASLNIQAEEAHHIIRTYWPEKAVP
ncbi:MAG: tetratricopeptide repeat protein [Candidatus Latescibacterota bacterium]|jgi:tetratricopeptide (TPR) repeat protein